ncbi:MAG: glutaconyl-CoA/methylmalonyl-CoA decarboxylase subunit delta [Clostridiales bacterium]|jgi:sodium pump decarboxylase gamma subunit|nr:glutaconyl-CoA/methylmalonyl-CoA decarboxylase subunit delta [Clostridiales bacterium]
MSILERFQHFGTFSQMSLGDKLVASLYVTLLGMGITFTALIIIWGVTTLMSKSIRKSEMKKTLESATVQAVATAKGKALPTENAIDKGETLEDELLIAVITAAIVAATGKSFTIKTIRRVDDQAPVWGKMSRRDVMNSRI